MKDSKKGPNWAHWCVIDQWTIGQAICLLLKVDPESPFGADIINQRFGLREGYSFNQRCLLEEAKRIFDLACASNNSGKLYPDRHPIYRGLGLTDLPPSDWIAWAVSKAIPIPNELNNSSSEKVAIRKLHWLQQDKWSEAELRDLLCGLEPDSRRENFEELNEAAEAIRRAASVGGALKPRDIIDPSWGDKLYLHDRFFTPAEAISWATSKPERFPKFPFSSADAPAKADEQANSTEKANLERIIGGLLKLLLTENAKQKDKPLFTKQHAIISILRDQKLCELSESKLQKVFAQANKVMAEQ